MTPAAPLILHATAVAVDGRALLIRGASGSGKSGLALEMMARGARLVSDDRVVLTLEDGGLWAAPPAPLAGLIEARGLGLLHAAHLPRAEVVALLDLDTPETERLPPRRQIMLHSQNLPLLHNVAHPYFPAALVQYLKGATRDPENG
ncbi:HPr kinase/phosphorylase [Salipiger mangrovisoli]|uniref:HPr kinase/phosphatase C-terminal domain-containing protein n=1 Tax=Salipiger mangrovisoli TaxID=2865933 RepID=A0ABR9WY22_9RHOB|nr:HPr kinase/phosphatase C-terminal domain-containing protein [Salipiger mangrovisoli]MBE9636174.1 HPr kinase/phosphatase C-terminal domain-containing protein [Salipiger mangrovisoli]